jgi:hypothetical protein
MSELVTGGNRVAVKSPSGKVVASSARETKRECIEDYIHTLIKTGVMVERREWFGLGFYAKAWRVMRRAGFRTVPVSFSITTDAKSGWSFPEVREVAA